MRKALFLLFISFLPVCLFAQDNVIPEWVYSTYNRAQSHTSPDGKTTFFLIDHLLVNSDPERTGLFIVRDTDESFIHHPVVNPVATHFSPDGEYLLVDGGTYVYRRFSVFRVSTQEYIGSFGYLVGTERWIDDRRILIQRSFGDRGVPGIEMDGIELISFAGSDMESTVLYAPSSRYDYIIDEYTDDSVVVRRSHVTFVLPTAENTDPVAPEREEDVLLRMTFDEIVDHATLE